jgi:hypothetical protein
MVDLLFMLGIEVDACFQNGRTALVWSTVYPQDQPDGRKAAELADVLRLVPLNGIQPRSGRIFKYARTNYAPTAHAFLLAQAG